MPTAISADQVKMLRDRTGAGFMECKAALTEAGGDIEAATTILRKRGLAQAAKKAGRSTSLLICVLSMGRASAGSKASWRRGGIGSSRASFRCCSSPDGVMCGLACRICGNR